MSAGLRALWTVRRGPWIFIFKLQQIVYILFWGQMGRSVWLQKHKFPPHTGRRPWYLLIVRLPGGGFHCVFSRCYYCYVCDGKKNKLSHTSRIVRSVTIPVVECWKLQHFCAAAEFLLGHADAAKQQVPVFICHLLEIRRNENTNLTHGDVFTHNWFPRYAALQLYGLLVDLVWTGLLSLAALNKHLLEVKEVGYVSRKINFTLQNSSKWNTSLLYKVSFVFLLLWHKTHWMKNASYIASSFIFFSQLHDPIIPHLAFFTFTANPKMMLSPFLSHLPPFLRAERRSHVPPGNNKRSKSQRTVSAKVGQGGAEVHRGL